MKQVFVDTNILIDLLADRPPFSKFAIQLFDLAEKSKVKLFTSSHAFATTHYLLKKHAPEKELRASLYSLLDYIDLISIVSAIIKKSLLSNYKDFEDAIQIIAATAVPNIDFIVTRNLKDFKDAGITVLAPDELLSYL
ncbi:type II toxin-antitoxin system VapC family toxin [Mucilaginibacter psychrotolerans]|uniref:PIN domain-containing protein n=1 Tax=Mucilaginibacter psychrotolerans TaxID=1524096 RepID=A0A4Y8SFU8_9SPHI|nr:PIN domain-containing protein [Mucilaginibacter psychrotolerans]TFF37551.1 PIN domain-containing protein [Mucilaginibacter psychrotolerans]